MFIAMMPSSLFIFAAIKINTHHKTYKAEDGDRYNDYVASLPPRKGERH